MLLIELVRRCEGLDSADPELARSALDLHELGPKNIIVVPDDPTHIVRRPFSPPPFFCTEHGAYPASPSLLVGCHQLAIRFGPTVVALYAHAVLALALARG